MNWHYSQIQLYYLFNPFSVTIDNVYIFFFISIMGYISNMCIKKNKAKQMCSFFLSYVSSISGPCSLRYCWKLVYKELEKWKILDSSWYVKLKGSQIILLLLHLHKMFKNSTALLFKTIGEKSF